MNMKLLEFHRWSDGRRIVEITSREEVGMFKGQIVYNSYPYAVTYNNRREVKIYFVSGADIQKASRIGTSNIPIHKIERHLIAARMSLYLKISDIANIMSQLILYTHRLYLNNVD